MYTVLARKWRPQVFEDLVGQQTVTQTLQNAISTGRIAHAFLFSGPRGVGKTTCARILAKSLNCHSSDKPVARPCGECPSCKDIAASRSMDVLEIDGASNRGIDEVRELRESARYQAIRDRFRVFIIDEVHMLTPEAFNALLKILEEPPPHVFFIFATTEQRKVPPTILSRCQLFEFKRIPDRILVQRLMQITQQEGIQVSQKSLEMIASASEGGLRDALGILDQIIAFSGQQIEEKDVQTVLGLVDSEAMFRLGEAIAKGDANEVLNLMQDISEYGIDYKVFYQELLSFYRDLFLIRYSPPNVTEERLRKLALEYDELQLLRICHQLVTLQNSLRLAGNLRFLFEVTLVKLSQMKKLMPLEEVVESLKKNVSPNAIVSAPVATTPPPRSAAPVSTPAVPLHLSASIPDDFFAVFISDLEGINARLAAALEHARVIRTGNKIIFYVPDQFYSMVRWDTESKRVLEDLLRRKLGGEVAAEVQRGNPPEEKQARKIATPETLVESDPMIQEFVKTFQGKISRIEFNKERYS